MTLNSNISDSQRYSDVDKRLSNLYAINHCSHMYTALCLYMGNISSIFSRNSEAGAAEFPEDFKEVLPTFFMHCQQLGINSYESVCCRIVGNTDLHKSLCLN